MATTDLPKSEQKETKDGVEVISIPDLTFKLSGKKEANITFILEAGVGSNGVRNSAIKNSVSDWEVTIKGDGSDSILKRLEEIGRVFRYNRLGQGEGPDIPSLRPIPANETVERLRLFLLKNNIQPPYFLLGHSIGGLYMQLFAKKYPDTVIGVIAIDTCVNPQMNSDDKDWQRPLPQIMIPTPDGKRHFCCIRKKRISAEYCETLAQKAHCVPKLAFPKHIPLHVISSEQHDWGRDTETFNPNDPKIATMREWHKALSRESLYGERIVVQKKIPDEYCKGKKRKGYPHFIHYFEPELIVSSVEAILKLKGQISKTQEGSLTTSKSDSRHDSSTDSKMQSETTPVQRASDMLTPAYHTTITTNSGSTVDVGPNIQSQAQNNGVKLRKNNVI